MEKKILKELIPDLENELQRLGYSKKSMRRYKSKWKKLLEYAEERKEIYFSEQLGIDFIENHQNILEKGSNGILQKNDNRILRIIRLLGDFQIHNTVIQRYRHKNKKRILNNLEFINILNDFKQYCIGNNYSKSSINHHISYSERFLGYINSQRIITFKEININLINNYIITLAGFNNHTIELHIGSLRLFHKYLYTRELISVDYSQKFPKIQGRKQIKIPSVWELSDLKKLITVIDRGNPSGKRNYAIILLACRLGIRTGDIKKLTFDNFHWEKKELEFIQSKTKTALKLPIPNDVGWAVIDYLKYGRPNIESPYVFILHIAPFCPFCEDNSLMNIITKYMKLANIPISEKKKTGMHSLRHTLASVLLENNTPLPVISNILGHIDMNSTAVYLKVDINKLKECSIDIQEDIINENK